MKIYSNDFKYTFASQRILPSKSKLSNVANGLSAGTDLKSMPAYKPISFSASFSENKQIYRNLKEKGGFFDADYYNNGPQSHKSNYAGYTRLPEFTDSRRSALIQKLGLKKADKVLDYGCAKGLMVEDFRDIGYNFHGYDISDYAISQANKNIKPYVTSDFGKLANDYDYVISKDVFEHVPYEKIDELLSSLKLKCNKMFVVVPLAKDGEYILEGDRQDPSHIIKEPTDWWIKKFEAAGFSVDEACHQVKGFLEHRTKNGLDGVGFFMLSAKKAVKSVL